MKLAIQASIGRAQGRRKPEQHGCNRRRSDGCAAFTLLEVILAVGIAVGLLFVVLFFYRQAALLRDQVLQKSEQISAIRLVMDQLTSDLRSVPPRVSYGTPLAGDGFTLQLVRTEVPGHANWTGGELGRAAYPETDLRLVSYSVGDGTNSFGLMRTVEPLVVKRDPPPSAGAVVMPEDSEGLVALPLTEEIQFIRFRFWDGTDWLDEWSSTAAPLAVEVSLGAEPLPEDATLDDYPYELFQRVVYLPAGGQSSGEEVDIMGIEVTSTGGER